MLSNFRMLEVEIHSKCNRKCIWCPNKEINRTEEVILSENIYLNLLEELNINNFGINWFGGVISYSRNNEPMLDINLLKKRTLQAKEILPNAKLVTNTNGDFLSKEALEGLMIDELSIMDYDCKGIDFCKNKLINLGATITEIVDKKYIYAQYNDMKIVYVVDWVTHTLLEDRGGFFNEINMNLSFKGQFLEWRNAKGLRVNNCLDPSFFIAVDYNGNVMPCCSVRSDNLQHQEYILGNLYSENIVDILFTEKAINFRNNMLEANNASFNVPCRYCQKRIGRYTRENPSIKFE